MSTKPRKRRFSHVLCKTTFEDGVLTVEGRMRLASLILLLFTGGIAYAIVAGELPIFVRLLMGFGGLITLYGFVDTFFGTCYLRYDTNTQELVAVRGNPFGKVEFGGLADGKVSVSRISAGRSNNSVPTYTVVLSVSLDDAIVNYPLEVQSYRDEVAAERIAHWEQALGLVSAP